MADNITLKESDGTLVSVASDEVTSLNGTTLTSFIQVERVKVGSGADGVFNDASASTPLPTVDATVHSDLAELVVLHTDLAAALAKLSADPATQTTLAAVLAKLTADPSTATNQASQGTKLDTLHADLGHLTDGSARVGGTVTTAPAVSGDVVTTLTGGRATVPTPGTAVRLGSGALPGKWVCVTALTSNAQQVNVGDSAVLAASGSSTGVPLLAGQSVTIPIADAHNVYLDARGAGEGVGFLVGA